MSIDIRRPFGPSVAKIIIPNEIVISMNQFVEETITDEKKSRILQNANYFSSQIK